MSVRGVPAQDLLENQDPAVLYKVDEVTKQVTPIVRETPAPSVVEEKPKPRRGRPPKQQPVVEEVPDAAEGEGE